MARSDLLRNLFAAYSRGDDRGFHAAAAEIIADERRKNHRVLAGELEHALMRDLRPGAADPLTLRPVPKTRDDRPLLRLLKPERDLGDLVLPPPAEEVILEIVAENRSRALLTGQGLRPRQRLLFVGPPGTGKSASAHAIASELSLPVAVVSVAALTSSFLGETARNVEAVVRFAESTPCVLLFDEIDALVGERSSPQDHAEMRRVVATVLQLLDDVRGESVLVATSNHPALIDSAIWRRFDEVIHLTELSMDGVERLVERLTRSVRRSLAIDNWAASLTNVPPAQIEMICIDALRRRAMSSAPDLTDKIFADAYARWQSRQAAIATIFEDT